MEGNSLLLLNGYNVFFSCFFYWICGSFTGISQSETVVWDWHNYCLEKEYCTNIDRKQKDHVVSSKLVSSNLKGEGYWDLCKKFYSSIVKVLMRIKLIVWSILPYFWTLSDSPSY